MTDLESALAEALRSRSLQEVNDRAMSTSDLAKTLDLFEDGARRLLAPESSWSIDTGLWVAEALGLPISFDVAGVKVSS